MNHLFPGLGLPVASAVTADIVVAVQSITIVALIAITLWQFLRTGGTRIRGLGMAQQLRESQKQLALVIEGSDLALWDRDLTDDRTEYNARWAEMLGYSLDEIPCTSESWSSRLHPDDSEDVLRHMQAHLDGDTDRFEAEYRLKTKSGGWIWVHSVGRVSQREADGTPLRICGINQDITARKKHQDDRRHFDRQTLESQKRESLGLLAGGIAHDFNNLLMGIMGNASLLGFKLADDTDAQQYLEDIDQSARRAADLCHHLLAYSGRTQCAVEPIDINATVDELRDLMSASISKKTTIECRLDQGLPTIDVDPSQFRQVIINLITNASEATEGARGVITVTTGTVHCDEHFLANAYMSDNASPGAYGFVEICDAGFGMSADTLSRAFEPFFSTKFSGRGLGLPAVLGIVQGHEGCLDIDTEPRKGTRIRALFPLSAGESLPHHERDHVSEDARMQGTIMVVDDDGTVRKVTKNMLERLGFGVITAVDGRDALRRFGEHETPIDCILLDLTMPHMDGEEAFDALYALDNNVCVLISSGYTEEDISHRFADREIRGFIQKPYDVDDLRDTMHRTMSERDGRTA